MNQNQLPHFDSGMIRSDCPRVAIVCDWLVDYSGAERVIREMLAIWPDADIFSTIDFLSEQSRQELYGRHAKTTFAQHLPLVRKYYRHYLPLMQLAIEQLDLSGYDLIVSSSHSIAKGVMVGPDQVHVSFVHTPMRYAWDMQHEYLAQAGLHRGAKSMLARYMLHRSRIWDYRTGQGVDAFVANSRYISRRIMRTYGRRARVIYPPVDTEFFSAGGQQQSFYFTTSRMVPYKRVDTIVEAFRQMPDKRLIVAGDGPEMNKIKGLAGPNVEILGFQSRETIRELMRSAKAFVFAAEEDFGIAPVEAQACGTPVIAFGRGGATETVRNLPRKRPTGLLFEEQTPKSIASAVHKFESRQHEFDPDEIVAHAKFFSAERFRIEFRAAVMQVYEQMGSIIVGSAEPNFPNSRLPDNLPPDSVPRPANALRLNAGMKRSAFVSDSSVGR